MISTQVSVKQVYQVACLICGQECIEGETYDFASDAEDARLAHIQEHREDGN